MSETTTPTPERAAPAPARKRGAGTVVLSVVFVLVIGWLYFAPPFITYGGQPFTACRPLGPEMIGENVGYGFPSYNPNDDAVMKVISDDGVSFNANEQLIGALGISEACSDARTNQQTTLIVVLAGGLAILLGTVIRRQTRTITLLRTQQAATGDGRRTGAGETSNGEEA